MWLYLFQGAGYGLAAASQPGPFQAYLISQAIARGWKRALPVALAPLVSDAPIIAVCLLALSRMPIWLERFLYLAGGLFVLRLAHGAFKAWRNFEAFSQPAVETNREQSVLKAALTNILNPNPYIFWILVTGPILLKGWRETPLNGVGFIAGFYLAMTTCLAGIVMVFGAASKFGAGFNRLLLGVSALALLGFGLYQIWLGAAG